MNLPRSPSRIAALHAPLPGRWLVAGLSAAAALAGNPTWAQATSPQAAATASVERRFPVSGYQVSGNTLLSAAQIDDALRPLAGERSLAELKDAAAVVQALYARAGYGAVLAFLPEQALDAGLIRITVLEGKLSQVEVVGNQQFSADNVRAGLPGLAIGQTPRLKEIDAQIQLVNENPAKQVQVLLQPGQKSGDVTARIDVAEQPVMRWNIGLDDTGNERTGEHRLNLGWQHANIAGLDHVLSTQFQTSLEKPQLVTVASVGYRVPFYASGWALDAFAAYSDVDGGSSATLAGDLQFAGRGRIVGMRLSKYLPRLGELDQRLSLGFEHRAYLNTCQVLGLPAGACGPAGESVAVQPLSLDYSLQRGGERAVGISATLVHNLALGGRHTGSASFDAVRPGASAHYTLMRSMVSASAPLYEEWTISARAAAQFSFNALVPGEQFGIGGASTVRGYEEREVAGDRGSYASVEVISPNLGQAVGLQHGSLRLVGFADVGYVENLLGTTCSLNGTACSLGSVGAGLRFDGGRVQARLFVAHALKPSQQTGDGDTRVHFTISVSF